VLVRGRLLRIFVSFAASWLLREQTLLFFVFFVASWWIF